MFNADDVRVSQSQSLIEIQKLINIVRYSVLNNVHEVCEFIEIRYQFIDLESDIVKK